MTRLRYKPGFERLEDRCTPATWGNPWPNSEHITLSFVPDGTQVGNQTSDLFSLLNAEMPTATWETIILKAFQTWAVNADINVGVVPDGGEPLGTPGLIQGDPRFGDIRIAAVDLGPNVVADTSPFDLEAGTWSGDVLLNSEFLNPSSGYDLFTVALHEAGHVFGLGDNNTRSSVMYSQYTGPLSGLSSTDVASLFALYPLRPADPNGTDTGNGTFATATPLPLALQSSGALEADVTGDLTSNSDVDVFSFSAPQLTTWDVTLQTSGVSLLESQVSIYNAWGNVIATAAATGPLNGDLQLSLGGLWPYTTYYIEVQSNSPDVFGMGAYDLNVQTLPLVNALTTGLLGLLQNTTTTLTNTLIHTNGSFATATYLPQQYADVDAHLAYGQQATIAVANENDFYELTAPQSPSGQSEVMTVMVWGEGNQGLLPTVQVFDANQNPVASQILVNDSGMFVIQIANATPGAVYYVEVSAAQPTGSHNVGNYFLGVDFGLQAVTLNTMAQGTLTASQPQDQGTLQIDESRLYHFVLSNSGTASVTMTISDAAGNVDLTLTAAPGQTITGNAYLAVGTYSVTFAMASSGSAPPTATYLVLFTPLDGQIGPRTTDPTGSPSQTGQSSGSGSGGGATGTSTTSGSTSSGSTSGYYGSYYYGTNSAGGTYSTSDGTC
jgi:hypothetical protein